MTSRAARMRRFIEETFSLPEAQPNPAKLRGPALGSRVRYVNTGRRHGQLGTVTQRWYLWAPDTRHGDVRGMVLYDDSVVRFDDGGSLVIQDRDLIEVTELHAFSPGQASYGQTPAECFYCWEPAAVHDDPEAVEIVRVSGLTTGGSITDNPEDTGTTAPATGAVRTNEVRA